MSFNSDDFDFLKGGLHTVRLANVSTITLDLENIGINGASTSSGALQTQDIMRVASPYAASIVSLYGVSNSGVLRSSGPGTVYSLYALNLSGAAAQYVQLHNSAVAIASGAVPVRSFKVGAAGTDKTIGPNELTALGETLALGVTYAWSTAPNMFVPADGNNYQLEVRLK